MRHGYKAVKSNRLVAVWQDEKGRYRFQGKRVGRNFPLTHIERRAYVEQGMPEAIKLIRTRLVCTFREAFDLLVAAMGEEERYG